MDIEEYKKHKRQMESDINQAIDEAIGRFRRATGRSPHSINIDLISVRQVQDVRDHFVVERVRTDVEI